MTYHWLKELSLENKVAEKVNHPDHYNKGRFEVIDVIFDWGLDFCLGNVVKYISRHKHKSNSLEDLKKAKWYLEYAISQAEEE
jgi:hypothetical protein